MAHIGGTVIGGGTCCAAFFTVATKNFDSGSSRGQCGSMDRLIPDGHKQLLRELQEERAAALHRISRTLESLIGELKTARERVRHVSGLDRERELAAWRDLRMHAVRYRWYLEVQREALGLRRQYVLDEFYRVPTLE